MTRYMLRRQLFGTEIRRENNIRVGDMIGILVHDIVKIRVSVRIRVRVYKKNQ